MTIVDLFASRSHYLDHMRGVFEALPPEMQGTVWHWYKGSPWGAKLPVNYRPKDRYVLVAGYADSRKVPQTPTIYMDHGAGQSYRGDPRSATHTSYAGASHPASIVAYLAPSDTVADRWRAVRPNVPVGVIGCPRLDPWLHESRGAPRESRGRMVAITFHWNCQVCPESKSALTHYRSALQDIVTSWRRQGFTVLGHGHPRAWDTAAVIWRSLGVEAVQDSAEVFDRAGVLVADNTSLIFEAAALDRPIVVLNAPWYRRDVNHGMRFWDQIPGVQIDEPDQLIAFDLAAYVDRDPWRIQRREVAGNVYAYLDGTSGQRGAEWIANLLAHATVKA